MKYNIIYADPPWNYKFQSPTASNRPNSQRAAGVRYYYDTMSVNDIKQLKIQSITEQDAVLYLWATNPMLQEALDVMQAWGFKYKTTITWHKLCCKGMGYWFRGHTEHLLFGVRGKVKAFRSLQHNIIAHPVGKHSEKPAIFRQMIELASPHLTRRIELFAREKVEGWDAWGNQIESDIYVHP